MEGSTHSVVASTGRGGMDGSEILRRGVPVGAQCWRRCRPVGGVSTIKGEKRILGLAAEDFRCGHSASRPTVSQAGTRPGAVGQA